MMNKYMPLRWKRGLSFLLDKKAVLVILFASLGTLGLMILSMGMGDQNIHPIHVVKAAFGHGSETENLIVQSFRLPRILIAVLVGASLAAAGAILQGIIRNPLASPDIIGITGGAGAAVVTFLSIYTNPVNNSLVVSANWLPFTAFIGATLAALIVYLLAWKNGVSPLTLVLIGIGFSAAMQGVITLMMIYGPLIMLTQANLWLAGSVYGSKWEDVVILLPWTCFFLTLAFVMARHLNVQELGDDLATGVGSAVQKQRLILLFICTALAGGAVAFAGGIGFVGLMAPHIARKLVGPSFGGLLPLSALIGGMIVLVADLIGRTAFSPVEVPTGVFTAAIGAPFFIYLLYKNRNQ